MQAAVCTRYGPPELLEVQEVPKPACKAHKIGIKVMAASVNSADVRVRGLVGNAFVKTLMRVALGFSRPRKSVLGVSFAGIVEEVGEQVSGFKAGDEVYGLTGFQFGAHAEYLTLSENKAVALKPGNASFAEAAALPFGGHTAIHFLEKAGIQQMKQPRVLIYGGTGSVGVAAIQIAQYYGADIRVVGSSRGQELLNKLGIRDLVLYDREDFTKTREQFDLIFDAVGKTSKRACSHLLSKGAVYTTVAGMESAKETKRQLEVLTSLFEQGRYQAVIDRTYPLAEVVEAHRYVDTGRKKGNVVLAISPSS